MLIKRLRWLRITKGLRFTTRTAWARTSMIVSYRANNRKEAKQWSSIRQKTYYIRNQVIWTSLKRLSALRPTLQAVILVSRSVWSIASKGEKVGRKQSTPSLTRQIKFLRRPWWCALLGIRDASRRSVAWSTLHPVSTKNTAISSHSTWSYEVKKMMMNHRSSDTRTL